MTILFLANNDAGLYHFRGELLERLVRSHQVHVCCPSGSCVQELKDLGCVFHDIEMAPRGMNPLKELRLFLCYIRLIRQVKPDLVLTYTIKPNVYGGWACRLAGIPYLANITGLGTSVENGGLLAVITKRLYRSGLRGAKCVFFQNSSNRDLFIREKLVRGKSRLIPGSGVNLERHYPEPYPDASSGIRFLFVGRVMKNKGVGELLQAMHTIHREYPETSLDLIGRTEEDFTALFREREQDGVRYLGLQKDVHPFYRDCHCVILPSYHEGTSNVMLEASATARPVITTRVPGCRETFDEGVTGFGCEAKSAESLAEAMRSFLALSHAEKERMGRAAREKMEREYDRRIVIRAYLEEISAVEKGAET